MYISVCCSCTDGLCVRCGGGGRRRRTQSTAAWAYGSNCGFADWHKLVMIGYMMTMMGLFANFFINSYGGKGKGKGKTKGA